MTHLHRLRGLVLALAVLLVTMSVSGGAFAGTLRIGDRSGVLSSSDASHLRAVVDAAPFDARLVFTGAYADAESLSRYVGSLADQRNLIAVGVDPEHRRVQVHFGPGTGIPRSAWPDIERAGNAFFAKGDWEGGAAAIFETATRAVSGASADEAPVATHPSHSSAGPLVLVLLLAGVIGAVVFFARRRGNGGGAPIGSGYGPGPGGYGYGQGPYGGPGYPQGYPPAGGGIGPFGAGAIGAGLGGLAGYELGKLEGEREERGREDARQDPWTGGDAADAPVQEEGGGGSSWGDDGGGFDSGGGGFDGGGGGGFDGGGGSDGGGSDF